MTRLSAVTMEGRTFIMHSMKGDGGQIGNDEAAPEGCRARLGALQTNIEGRAA